MYVLYQQRQISCPVMRRQGDDGEDDDEDDGRQRDGRQRDGRLPRRPRHGRGVFSYVSIY